MCREVFGGLCVCGKVVVNTENVHREMVSNKIMSLFEINVP